MTKPTVTVFAVEGRTLRLSTRCRARVVLSAPRVQVGVLGPTDVSLDDQFEVRTEAGKGRPEVVVVSLLPTWCSGSPGSRRRGGRSPTGSRNAARVRVVAADPEVASDAGRLASGVVYLEDGRRNPRPGGP